MTEECGASNGSIMILACSGANNVGQLANQAAVELTQAGFGKMFCLAGIGARSPRLVQAGMDAERMIVIDGCGKACGKTALENAGVPLKTHLVVTKLGINKNKDLNLKREEIQTVKDAVQIAFIKQLPPSAMPRMSGGGCCCGG